jgi:hypothetical protein
VQNLFQAFDAAAGRTHTDFWLRCEADQAETQGLRMTEHRELQPEETISEPVSPELVLVDPQLANLARERLRVFGDGAALKRRAVVPASDQVPAEGGPDARAASPGRAERLARERLTVTRSGLESQDDRLTTPSAVAESDIEFSAISPADAEDAASFERAKTRRHGVLLAALAAFAVVAAGFSILRLAQSVSDAGQIGIRPLTTPMEPMPVQRTGDARQNRRTSEIRPTGAGTTSPRSAKSSVQPKKQLQPVRPSEFPTRVFVWPAVSRATFYKVEFFRRGRKIFDASPTMPRIELPLRWVFRGRHFRLTPATYRWEVRAAFGPRSRPRYGQPITRSTWTAR